MFHKLAPVVLLDSWDRNNAILVNLLRAIPEGGLAAKAMEGGPSISEMFTHMHHERMVPVSEEAPEFAGKATDQEWMVEHDPECIARMLMKAPGSCETP